MTMVSMLLYSWGMMRKNRPVTTASMNSSESSTETARAMRLPVWRLLLANKRASSGRKMLFSSVRTSGCSR